MKLSDVRVALDELGMAPSKSLGQNFLVDRNMAAWVAAQAQACSGDTVLEVGPGLGALTQPLLEAGAKVLALEKDGRLAGFLKREFEHRETFQIRHQDALDFDVRDLFPMGVECFVGNLPYYVSSQILMHFTAAPSPLKRFVITFQRELAERIAAPPDSEHYGGLSVLIQSRFRVRLLRMLGPGLFFPVPKVDSAVLLLEAKEEGSEPAHDRGAFVRLVKQGFSQRRKQLRKLLGTPVDWETRMEALGLPPTVRAETLSVEQWIQLTQALHPLSITAPQRIHDEVFDVVNDQDVPVSKATRAEVHAKDLLHRAVHLFVLNQKGDLFLQKRSAAKDRHPGCWDSSAAGHLDAGEDYAVGASRELKEELGVEAEVTEIGRLSASPKTGHEFVRIYSAHHEGPFVLAPAEISTGAFFTKSQIRTWVAERPQDFAPAFLECWKVLEMTR